MTGRDTLLPALRQVAGAMAAAQHPWWVISSAAVVLHGFDPGPVGDIDVLFDPRDAAAVLEPLGLVARAGEGTALFRSQIFAVWQAAGVPVELFAGFEINEGGQWNSLLPRTCRAVPVGEGAMLYVPERSELRELFLRFGRPKDLVRAEILSPSAPFPSRSDSA